LGTHRAESLGWGPAEALGEDIVGRIRRLKSEAGPDLIVWGSATLAPLLLENGLVDERVLVVYPLVLGRGKRCFSDRASPRACTLVGSTPTPSGVLLNVYRAVPSRPGAIKNSGTGIPECAPTRCRMGFHPGQSGARDFALRGRGGH
jgi:hypothetical protein